MSSTLDALIHLQAVERQHRDVLRRLENRRRRIRQQHKRIQQLDEQVHALDDEIKRRQAEADRMDLDIQSRNNEVAKLRAQLNTVKTNREYSAILTQINTDKADGSKLEDRLLTAMTEVDEVRQQRRRATESRQQEAAKLAELQSDLAQAEEACREELDELETRLAAAREAIPPTVLGDFNRSLDVHEGEAMARVLKPFPKRDEFVCDGCNMSVTLEQVNALRSRSEDIQFCHSCHRILYLDDVKK